MLITQTTGSLKEGCAGFILQHPVAGKATVLDVLQDALHFGLGFRGDDARTSDIFAIFGGVRDRVIHVGDAAFIDQIHDQLHFVQALKISHLRRIAGFNQGFKACTDQFNQTAA